MRSVAVVVLLLLGACAGDDGDERQAAPSSTAPSSTAPSSTSTSTVPERASAGCDRSAPVEVGQERVELGDRWYLRHVPPAAEEDAPLPLVVDLHGYSEGAEVHVQMSALAAHGDAQGFVTVTPQGTGAVPRWDATLGSPDVDFISAVIDDVEDDLCIDRNRIHVAGLSNGAFMTSVLACALADRIASVAAVAGVRAIGGCDPARPVPLVAFHGTADGYVAFDGGLGEKVEDLPAPDGSGRSLGELGVRSGGGAAVPEIMEAWAVRNGCEPEPREEPVADDVTRVRFDCPVPVDVELYRVADGGHAWPGSEFSAAVASFVGRTTMAISATEIMWEFFRAHPLR